MPTFLLQLLKLEIVLQNFVSVVRKKLDIRILTYIAVNVLKFRTPKFLAKYIHANCADPDQTASEAVRIYSLLSF